MRLHSAHLSCPIHFQVLAFATALIFLSPLNQVDGQTATNQRRQLSNAENLQVEKAKELSHQVVRLTAQGDYELAGRLAKQAVSVLRQLLGPENMETAIALNNLAMVYQGQGKLAEADPMFRSVVAVLEKINGPNHTSTAAGLHNLASNLLLQANYTTAQPLLQRVLKIREKELGDQHPDTATTLNELGFLYKSIGNYKESQSLFQRVLRLRERHFGTMHQETAIALNNLAMVYKSQANYAEAEPLYQRALQIYEKTLGGEHVLTATSLNNLAEFYSDQAKYLEAEPLYHRALKIYEKTLGSNHPDTAQVLNNMGYFYVSQGKYSAADPLHRRALKIREDVLPPNHPDTAQSLNNIGLLYEAQGNYEAAKRFHQRALKIFEITLGVEHSEVGDSCNNLGGIYRLQGYYSDAMKFYQRALKIREITLGTEHPRTAQSYFNLAGLYELQGNFQEAERLVQQAYETQQKVFGPEHPETARSLEGLAFLQKAQANYLLATSLFERVLSIYESAFGDNHPQTAHGLKSLANAYQSQDRNREAESLYKRALAIREKALGAEHDRTAQSLNDLAGLYFSQSNFESAESLYERALTIYAKTLGTEHPETLNTRNNLANVYMHQDKVSQALPLLDEVRRGQRIHVMRVLPGLPAQEQDLFLHSRHEPTFHFALSAALTHPDLAGDVNLSATWLANGKGVAHEALAQRNLLTRDIDHPQRGTAVMELLSVRSQLARLAMTAAEAGKEELRNQEMASLAKKEVDLVSQLSSDTVYAAADWIDRAKIRAALPSDSVLIDIARFEVYNFTAQGEEPKWQPAKYAAWITFPGMTSNSVLVDLGDAVTIDGLVERVRQQIAADASQDGAIAQGGEDVATEQLMKDLQALSARIWEPLASHVGEAKQIVLSPDGALWLAPWNALPIGDAAEEYLLERYNLRMIISGRDLLPKPSKRTTQPSVILANPAFDQPKAQKLAAINAIFKTAVEEDEDSGPGSFSAQRRLPRVQPLPNTGVEALAIQPHIDAYTGKPAVLYQEQYALEQVAKKLHGPQIAAFATHGFFMPEQKTDLEARRLLLADTSRSVALDRTGAPLENPLLRCGLLLSGCNDREAIIAGDDGILTGMEIVGIDFRGTEMVVLSACETGIGDVKSGEGVAGLRQAFQLAGAEAVVATLWQVPDRDSALLMSKFFAELADGKSKTDALRRAQLERIEKRRERYGAAHPFFWAAFTLTGI